LSVFESFLFSRRSDHIPVLESPLVRTSASVSWSNNIL
jgi:hypothetical protein